jgi:hypothetical protein
MNPVLATGYVVPISNGGKRKSNFRALFAQLSKAAAIFIMSIHPSAWNNSAVIKRIFMRLDI